jgi:methylmalonyl-CoA mutase, N-terminal domain
VNRFQSHHKDPIPIHRLNPSIEVSQVSSLQHLRSRRANSVVGETLDDLEKAAAGPENLMPLILRAVEAYATVGEICDRLRRVFGEHKEG